MKLLKVNYNSQEISENYDWISYSRKSIVDLIKELQDLHGNGYTAVEMGYDCEEIILRIYRFETVAEANKRILKEEKIVTKNKSNEILRKEKLKLKLIKDAKKLGMKFQNNEY